MAHFPTGVIHSVDCITSLGTFNFDTTLNYTVKAGEFIEFNQNTHISNDNAHQFHAYIEQPSFDLAWYGPSTSGSIGQFEKLEIGLQFDSIINNKIINFVDALTGDSLNPFNPLDIDVHAEFWHFDGASWQGPYLANGFYFEEFTRGNNNYPEIPLQHNFRFRYTPRELGSYRCVVTAVVKNQGTFVAPPFNFQSVPSNSKDFVRVGDNNHYLRIGDEPFFPVGHNLSWPLAENGSAGVLSFFPQIPTDYYLKYHAMLDTLKMNGANYFRFINAPWATDIEFEKLGDYSDRMAHAWELDEIIDHADSLDLRIHFNNQIHTVFEAALANSTFWDWSAFGDPSTTLPCFSTNDNGYCYRSELGLLDPVDFFTDVEAKKHYKNKLRYTIARWGYSTSIAVFELLSESSNSGRKSNFALTPNDPNKCFEDLFTPNESKPYINAPYDFPPKIFHWHDEMGQYIKEELKHTNHPLAVSYGPPLDLAHGDSTYYSPYIDINTRNSYRQIMTRYEQGWNFINDLTDLGPFMHSEYGPGLATFDCDGGTHFIKSLMITPFLGLAGAAINWDFQRPGETELWHYMQPIRDFMEGIPLDEENWQAVTPIIQTDKSVEVYYLRTPLAPNAGVVNAKAVGVVANRAFNYFTQGTKLPCTNPSQLEIDNDSIYQTPTAFEYNQLSNPIKLPSMAYTYNVQYVPLYVINWYNALTGTYISSNLAFIENQIPFGLEIAFPAQLTGSSDAPLLFFEAYPLNDPIKSQQINDDPKQTTNNQIEAFERNLVLKEQVTLNISPNPTHNIISIHISGANDLTITYDLIDINGKLLKTEMTSSTNFTLDLSVYERGVYYLNFMVGKNQFKRKIIKL